MYQDVKKKKKERKRILFILGVKLGKYKFR